MLIRSYPPLIGIIILSLSLFGCTGVAKLADTLNERQVTSCLWYQGGYGVFMQMQGVTATGGASLETCLNGKKP